MSQTALMKERAVTETDIVERMFPDGPLLCGARPEAVNTAWFVWQWGGCCTLPVEFNPAELHHIGIENPAAALAWLEAGAKHGWYDLQPIENQGSDVLVLYRLEGFFSSARTRQLWLPGIIAECPPDFLGRLTFLPQTVIPKRLLKNNRIGQAAKRLAWLSLFRGDWSSPERVIAWRQYTQILNVDRRRIRAAVGELITEGFWKLSRKTRGGLVVHLESKFFMPHQEQLLQWVCNSNPLAGLPFLQLVRLGQHNPQMGQIVDVVPARLTIDSPTADKWAEFPGTPPTSPEPMVYGVGGVSATTPPTSPTPGPGPGYSPGSYKSAQKTRDPGPGIPTADEWAEFPGTPPTAGPVSCRGENDSRGVLTRRIPKGRKGEAVLADTAELLDVLREVCEVDPIKDLSFDSERDKLQWVAAAEHARAKATSNPVGFFTTVVTKGLWGYITNAAEESARRRLQKLDRQLRGYENP